VNFVEQLFVRATSALQPARSDAASIEVTRATSAASRLERRFQALDARSCSLRRDGGVSFDQHSSGIKPPAEAPARRKTALRFELM